ncbi:MAG TPA: hypothetical protein VF215_07420 [Thermoanaerobaculia bacterium]
MCESAPGDYERCFDGLDYCITTADRCSIPSAQSTVLSDWAVASIEISRPAMSSVTDTTPAAAAEVPAAAPTSQTTELK